MSGNGNEYPVFFDPTGRRKYIVSATNWGLVAVLGGLLAFLLLTIASSPNLPSLDLTPEKRPLQPDFHLLAEFVEEPQLDPRHERRPSAEAAARAVRYGYLVNWDDNSFVSLKRNAGELDVAIVEWLHLASADGTVVADDPVAEAMVTSWVRKEAPGLKLMPLINNYSPTGQRWMIEETRTLLQQEHTRSAFARSLASYVRAGGHAGLVLDLEQIHRDDRDHLTALVEKLGPLLAEQGRKLLVAVRPDDDAYDLGALARHADGIIAMLYDEHQEDGPPGPLAGQGWFEVMLERMTREVGADKLVVSIGSYGYDWGSGKVTREISFQEALELLGESGSKLSFEPGVLNPGFGFIDEDGVTHREVWYLDAATAFNQISDALAARAAGIALWRLGTEDPAIWSILGRGRMPNAATLGEISELKAGYDVHYRGAGEALTVTGERKDGRRRLVLDESQHLVVEQHIEQFPTGTTIMRWGGGAEKVIALTFDDGPDPVYTPRILDILAAKGVKATFFVVGSAAAQHSALLKRIYAEGHDIGNHTFTHVNSAEVSQEQLRLEINAAQRLIEATIGARTHLFRPPYAKDIEPQTVDAAASITLASELGYITLAMDIDPKDWMRALPRQIVDSVLADVARGRGKVVLLHDAGGSRTPTVEALPIIIDRLREQGYSFVTAHELLKLDRNAVMPTVKPDEQLVVAVNSVGFTLFDGIATAMVLLFYFGILLGTLRLMAVTVLGLVHNRKSRRTLKVERLPVRMQRLPTLAVLIPAYNEEAVIAKSITAMLLSPLRNFEIIVIDDGSSDDTAGVVRRQFSDTSRVKVFKKPNGGKAAALNFGLTKTDAEIIVALDADTIFLPDALGHLLAHFADPKVGAVAGATKVGNTINMITCFQALEYVTSQNLDRRALELANSITVVPGAIGAWRRKAVLEAGGYSSDTLAEDADLTIRLERNGWKVVYEPDAIARTEAPETIRSFLKQRFRWMFGTLQAAYKHRAAFLSYRNGTGVGLFGLPNILLFQFIFTLVSPIIDIVLLWNIIAGIRAYEMNPAAGVPDALVSVATYWAAFQLLDLATSMVAVGIDRGKRVWHLLPLLLVQRFTYRQLLYVVAIKSALAALKGSMVGWGKLKRTNSVELETPRQ